MNFDKLNKQYEALHGAYERKSVQILVKEFRKIGRKIPFDNLTFDNAEIVIGLNMFPEDFLYKIHWAVGKHYGNLEYQRMKREEVKLNIPQEKRRPSYPLFNKAFQLFLLEYYAKYGGTKITLLTDTYAKAVADEIIKGTKENETLDEMRKRIQKAVDSPNFYKWQALRIARTETTFAMNAAKAQIPMNPRLTYDKVWSSALDKRTRPSHFMADMQKVAEGEKFLVGDSRMEYPGDPTAEVQELVNCRCAWYRQIRVDEDGLPILN